MDIRRLIHLIWLAALVAASPAAAQTSLCGNATLSVTTTTANVALPSTFAACPFVVLKNDGPNEIFYKPGNTNAVTAVVTNYPLASGDIVLLQGGPATYVAAITSTSTSTLRVVQYATMPQFASGGAAAAGGSSTISNFPNPVDTGNGPPTASTVRTDPTQVSTVAAAGSSSSSVVIKNAAANLSGVYWTTTTPGWGMVFNAASAPSNGATTAGIASGNLQDCVYIPAVGSWSLDYSKAPHPYSAGITAMFSSTGCGTLTASANAFITGAAQ